jgi:polysaccharide export outer membrane protein
MAKTLACVTAVWTLLLVQTCAGQAQQARNSIPNSAPSLEIGPGDLIEVTVYENPDLSGRFRVDAKGDVDVPLLSLVHVEGETAEEAGTTIETAYVKAEILTPSRSHATVFIAEYATTQQVVVSGEVRSPGLFPVLGIRMLNDVITSAGGVLQTAASRIIITRKNDPQNPITVEYNPSALNPVIPHVQIFPGDTITVSRAGIVYVIGDVARAGGYVLDGRNTLTVEEAMALAGGSARNAKLKAVQLVRTLPGGAKVMITLSMSQIYKGKSPDLAMQDGDILYVPTSTAKMATEQAITAAVSIGTSLIIYKTVYQ